MTKLERILGELRAPYLLETLARAASMSKLITELERNPATRLLSSLEGQFHGLAGTGTSYGFEELSRLGQLGERSAAEARKDLSAACSPDVLQTLRGLVAKIESTTASALGERIEP